MYRIVEKHDQVTKFIFGQIFFLALFEEKLNKLLDQLNISRISGSTIRYPTGRRISKRPDYLAGYPVNP
jgi:hypothetical protein